MSAPFGWTLVRAVEATKSGEVSSRELTLACLDRAQNHQPEINAFVAFEADRALAAADAADAARSRGEPLGPLHGVPLAHKDMYDRAGRVTSCGSKIRAGHVASATATALERLDAAGAVDLGRLNMSEFAMGPTGFNAHFGRARNPWNLDVVTGGSSSGSGAALAAGFIYGALGSDTGGSIRLPAAMCGVAGLKPTQGRVSRFGAMPLSTSQDCVGPLAPMVADVALLYSVIAGPDPRDPCCATRTVAAPARREDLKGVRIGVPTRFYGDDVDAEVLEAMALSRAGLADLGATLVEVDLPDQTPLGELANIVAITEAASLHYDWLRERRGDYGEQVGARLMQGLVIPAVAYFRARQMRVVLLSEFVAAAFSACDALHVPVLPFTPPRSADVDIGASPAMPNVIAGLTRFTRPFSFLGLPALAQPIGFSAAGLPLSMQLVAKPFGENVLLEIGMAYEKMRGAGRPLPDMPTATSKGKLS
jgi:aspartyl-tRNA(Asn)/glutamyl-tRNA(Gln) amidotransferase subunit A